MDIEAAKAKDYRVVRESEADASEVAKPAGFKLPEFEDKAPRSPAARERPPSERVRKPQGKKFLRPFWSKGAEIIMEGQQNRIEEVRWTPEVAPSYLTGLVAEDGICKKHAAGYFSTCKCENRCGVTYFAERRAVEVECNQSGIYDPGRGVRYL